MDRKDLLDLFDKSIVDESDLDERVKEMILEFLKTSQSQYRVTALRKLRLINKLIKHHPDDKNSVLPKYSHQANRGYGLITYGEEGPPENLSSEFATPDTSKTESSDEITLIKAMLESLGDAVDKLGKENSAMKELLYSDATSFNDSKVTQTLPISIFLDSDDPEEIFEVYDSVMRFSKSIGFDESIEFDAIRGSWYKRILAQSMEKLSSEEVLNRLKEAEYGIEVNTVLRQQSEIDKNQSEALANIITSLKDIPNAAIRIGALIVVKVTDNVGSVSLQTRTLSIKELHLLNKKPELLQMPKQILEALANGIKDSHAPDDISEN